MKPQTIRSKRLLTRYKRADRLAREVRFLVSNKGGVNQGNADKLMPLLLAWMDAAGKDKYKRPKGVRPLKD